MPNTKATGVAYSDPQFDSVTVTGASSLQAVTATTISATAVTATSITNSGPTTGAVRLPVASDRKSTRLNSSHIPLSRMPSSA